MNKRLFMLRNRTSNGPMVDDNGAIITFDNKPGAKVARDTANIGIENHAQQWKVSPGPDHRRYVG